MPDPPPDWFVLCVRRLRNLMLVFLLSEPGAIALLAFSAKKALTLSNAGTGTSVGNTTVAPLHSEGSPCDALADWLFNWLVIFGWLFYWRFICMVLMCVSMLSVEPTLSQAVLPDIMVNCVYVGFPIIILALGVQVFSLTNSAPECRAADPSLYGYAESATRTASFVFLLSLVAGRLIQDFKKRAQMTRDFLEGKAGPSAGAIVAQISAGCLPTEDELRETECSICLGSGEPPEEWRRLGCGHVLHLHCVEEWLVRAQRCPLCRFDLRRACLDAGGSTSLV